MPQQRVLIAVPDTAVAGLQLLQQRIERALPDCDIVLIPGATHIAVLPAEADQLDNPLDALPDQRPWRVTG